MVLVTGSRSIADIDISEYLKNIDVLLTGGAKGVDSLAITYAEKNGIKHIEILPNYAKYNRAAPVIRDEEMVKMCDRVVAIWDGKSKGTKHTIDFAKKYRKPIDIHIISNEILL